MDLFHIYSLRPTLPSQPLRHSPYLSPWHPRAVLMSSHTAGTIPFLKLFQSHAEGALDRIQIEATLIPR